MNKIIAWVDWDFDYTKDYCDEIKAQDEGIEIRLYEPTKATVENLQSEKKDLVIVSNNLLLSREYFEENKEDDVHALSLDFVSKIKGAAPIVVVSFSHPFDLVGTKKMEREREMMKYSGVRFPIALIYDPEEEAKRFIAAGASETVDLLETFPDDFYKKIKPYLQT